LHVSLSFARFAIKLVLTWVCAIDELSEIRIWIDDILFLFSFNLKFLSSFF
jgi:hypothetical protein